MSHARYRPPDPSRGDESTIAGYAAVHDRPAAFEGTDGYSYSVELMAEPTGEPDGSWGGFFLFVKWARMGAQSPEGHLETDYLVRAGSEGDALATLGETSLSDVKALLDRLIADRLGNAPTRRWWDAMREDPGDDDSADGDHE